MSRFTRLSLLGEWPSLAGEGPELRATAYQRPDGMRYVCFRETAGLTAPVDVFGQTTRVSYRSQEGHALFLGMFVNPAHRGRRLGERLVAHFMSSVEEMGDRFIGTGMVHKPLVALSLGRAGLQPVSDAFLAEILPRAASDVSATPKIDVLRNNLPEEAIVDRSPSGQFYEVVPPVLAARYPINAPDMIVALHTPYVVPEA